MRRICRSWRGALWAAGVMAVGTLATVTGAAAQQAAPKTEMRLEPVVVTATRSGLIEGEAPASVTVLDHDDVQESANISVDDILRRIPGFSLYRRSSSMVISPDLDPEAQGVTLRGVGPSGASRALVMVDGIPVINPFDGQVFWGKISKDQIERIEVVRGSGASLWGNYAMAGVINIITRKPTETGGALTATYGTNGLTDDDLFLSGRSGPWRIGFEGNFFDTDGYPIVTPSQRGPFDGSASSRHELFNGRVGYQLNDSDTIFLHGQFFDEVHNDGTKLRNSSTRSGLLDLTSTVHSDDGSEWQTALFSNLQTFDIQFSEFANEDRTHPDHRTLKQTIPFTDVGGSVVWSRRVAQPLVLTAGGDMHWIDGQSRDRIFDEAGVDVEQRQRSDGKQALAGFFLQGIYTPTARWEFALSGRADLWTNYDGTQTIMHDDGTFMHTSFENRTRAVFSPKLSILYRATDWLHVRGAAYRGFRAPTLAELYRRSAVEDLQLLPNPNLSSERLNGAEMGVDLPILNNLDLRATGFWNEVEDPVTNVDLDPDSPECATGATPGEGHGGEEEGAPCRKRLNLGLARTIGAEVEALYEIIPGLTLYGSYLFADATLVSAPGQDADLEGKQLAQIPPHSFTVGTRYSNPSVFTLVLEGRFVDDQFEDADNHERLGSYFVLNGSLSRRLPFWNGEVFLAAENLFDREYTVDLGGDIRKLGGPLLGHGGVRLRF